MTDFSAMLLNPIYAMHSQATHAVLDLGSDGTVGLRVLDKTSGVQLDFGGDVSVNTIKPACTVRMTELAQKGIDPSSLKGLHIAFNSASWRIENKLIKTGLAGESTGELYMVLTADG